VPWFQNADFQTERGLILGESALEELKVAAFGTRGRINPRDFKGFSRVMCVWNAFLRTKKKSFWVEEGKFE
jgi:hypothetical protein